MERERKRGLFHFKELDHVTVGAGKTKIWKASWEAGNSGRVSILLLATEVQLQETSGFPLKAFS